MTYRTRIILSLPLTIIGFAALAQTAPAPTPDKPKQSGFVSPDGSSASILNPAQKQLSDDVADQVFRNENELRLLQSQLAVAKAKSEILKLNQEPEKPVALSANPKQPIPNVVTSSIETPVADRVKVISDPQPHPESKVKILMIMGPTDRLIAVVKIDQLGSVQVKKNDIIPIVDLIVTDIDSKKITAQKFNGEVVHIPFIL